MEESERKAIEAVDDEICDLFMEAHWYAKDSDDREKLKKRLGRIIDKIRPIHWVDPNKDQ